MNVTPLVTLKVTPLLTSKVLKLTLSWVIVVLVEIGELITSPPWTICDPTSNLPKSLKLITALPLSLNLPVV